MRKLTLNDKRRIIVQHAQLFTDDSKDLGWLNKRDLLDLLEVAEELEKFEICVRINKLITIVDRDEKLNEILK